MHLLLALALAAWPIAATAEVQPPAAQNRGAEPWVRSETRIASVPARIAFPVSAGPLSFTGTSEFSHPGEGIDGALQYRSADGAVTGTVYVYHPGLAQASLAALATDRGIRANSTTPVQAGPPTVVAAGNRPATAIRADYTNYKGGHASSAAFIKAGRWIVKLRVSAPKGREGAVEAAMTALLRGIQFGAANTPRPAAVLTPVKCAPDLGRSTAKPLPDPEGADLVALAMLGTFDAGGNEAADDDGGRKDLPSRIPQDLCVSGAVDAGGGEVQILRSADGPPAFVDGRTRLLLLLNDAGDALELVHVPNFKRFVLLHHLIGETRILGSFDGVPSDAQVADMLRNGSPQLRVRAGVRFRPGRGPEINVPALVAPKPAKTS